MSKIVHHPIAGDVDLHDEDAVYQANKLIWDANFAFWDNEYNLPELKLRRIDLTKNHPHNAQDSRHDDISKDKIYLAIDGGVPRFGTFSLQWYGWNFHSGGVMAQLNLLDALYETNLQYVKAPYEMLHHERDEDEEYYGY